MPYAVRNDSGQVTSLHRHDPGVGELLNLDDPAVRGFLGLDEGMLATAPGPAFGPGGVEVEAQTEAGFSRLDAEFIRVLEDVIDALLSRNLLSVTDLPDIAQIKLFARKSFRERRPNNALDLFRPGDLDPVML